MVLAVALGEAAGTVDVSGLGPASLGVGERVVFPPNRATFAVVSPDGAVIGNGKEHCRDVAEGIGLAGRRDLHHLAGDAHQRPSGPESSGGS
jgi:hypothetical protein